MSTGDSDRRWDWQHNHAMIRDAILTLLGDKKDGGLERPPSVKEIAAKTGLTQQTVYEHLKRPFDPIESPARALIHDVDMGITKSAIEGNPAAAKLYYQLFHGFTEKSIVVTDPPKPLSEMTDEELDEYERSLSSEKSGRNRA